MPSLLESMRTARKLVPKTREIYVAHDGQFKKDKNGRELKRKALTYFNHAQCPHAFIEWLLTKDGKLRKAHESCQEKPLSLSDDVAEFDQHLWSCLQNIYELANGSLDHIYNHGFNKHDSRHIEQVTETILSLLTSVGATDLELKQGLVIGRAHDLGNILSRKLHSLVSPQLLLHFFPELAQDPVFWREVRRGIQLHNEPIADALITSFNPKSEDQKIGIMRRRFSKAALATIIADKTDIGRHRISEKPKTIQAVNEDPHLEVNLLGKTESVGLSEDKKVMTWKLQFLPELDGENETDMRFIKASNLYQSKLSVQVSETTKRLHQEENIPYFARWKNLFWELYFDRVILTIRAAFALVPELTEYSIVMEDKYVGETSEFKFKKETFGQQLDFLKRRHNQHKES